MKKIVLSVEIACIWILLFSTVLGQNVTSPLYGLEPSNCFKFNPSIFKNSHEEKYQSNSVCSTYCQGSRYIALYNGGTCFCLDNLSNNLEYSQDCDTPCQGYGVVHCGGYDAVNIWARTRKDATFRNSTSESATQTIGTISSSSSSSVAPVPSSSEENRERPDAIPGNNLPKNSKIRSGLSRGAAAGIIVGVLAAVALLGGLTFLGWRKRKTQRNSLPWENPLDFDYNTMDDFKFSNTAVRRDSNGSLDERQYGLRTLRVMNPDG